MSCDLEIYRHLKMRELRQMYIDLCLQYFGWQMPPKNSFGRWLNESLVFNTVDPLIPNNDFPGNPLYKEISEDFPNKIRPILDFIRVKSKLSTYVDNYLAESRKILDKTRGVVDIRNAEVIYNKIHRLDFNRMGFARAHEVTKNLTKEMNIEMVKIYKPMVDILIETLVVRSAHYAHEISELLLPPQDYIITHTNDNQFIEFSYTSHIAQFNSDDLTKIKMPILVLDILRNKSVHNNINYDSMLRDIWVVYKRYTTFIEADIQSSSLQAAVPYKLMNFLNKHLGVNFECFASPINSYFRSYCSAFNDTDKNFGSKGSFFQFNPTSGSYEANPPFSESLMTNMVIHMENLLTNSREPLSFTVFVPRWEDAEAIVKMKSSTFLTRMIIVKAGEHVFRQSDQKQEFKAIHDTLIFFLQNEAGARVWTVTEDQVVGLMAAFGDS